MHYIIYHDKSQEQVEDRVAEIIWQKSSEGLKGVELNGSKYLFSSIAKILKEDDYFKQYPDRRPESSFNQFEENYSAELNQVRQPTERAKEFMRGGFIGYHTEQGKTAEQAEEKWNDLQKAGSLFRMSKLIRQ
jgi:hypothetical protein